MATEAVAANLASHGEWVDLLKRFDTDIDARIRALAIDPGAHDLMRRIRKAGTVLMQAPLPAMRQEAADRVKTARQAELSCQRRQDAAYEAWRQAKREHDDARAAVEQAEAAERTIHEPFHEFAKHVPELGAVGLEVLHDPLMARGVRIKGDSITLPE